jgi:hypothetical protein
MHSTDRNQIPAVISTSYLRLSAPYIYIYIEIHLSVSFQSNLIGYIKDYKSRGLQTSSSSRI